MMAGVPQGSILGPTLWNITYNRIFNLDLPSDSEIIRYADDIVVVVKSAREELLEIRANEAIRQIDKFLDKLSLEIAPHKSEGIIFTKKHKVRPPKSNTKDT